MKQQWAWPVLGATVVTLLLVIGSGITPFLALLIHLLIPFPAAWVFMAIGPWAGGGVVILCAAGMIFYSGWGGASGYLLNFGISSFCLPFLLWRSWPWDRAILVTLLIVATGSALLMGGFAFREGKSMTDLLQTQVRAQLEEGRRFSAQADLSAEQREELEQLMDQVAGFVHRTYPALTLVANGAMLLFLLLMLSRAPGIGVPIAGSDFKDWVVTPWLIWVLIGGGFGSFLGLSWVKTVAFNLVVIVLPIYFMQGLAIVSFFFWKRHVAPWLRVVGYVLAVTLNPLPLLVTGVGIFDLWVDFRKPKIKKSG